jgi:hypothetical protein
MILSGFLQCHIFCTEAHMSNMTWKQWNTTIFRINECVKNASHVKNVIENST